MNVIERQHNRIGFIGLGSMGYAMAHCLLRSGWKLDVFGRRAEVVQPLVDAGARSAASPAELARECDLVFLSLPDAAVVEEVVVGGLAQGLRKGAVVIDTSTISAASAREFGARLDKMGIAFLDAPVSGGQQGAEAGTLTCMVGGSAQVLDACRDVIGAFAKTITQVGALGAGQAIKACNQVAVSAALLGVAEAIALARAQGVDPAVMREVLLGGTARSFSLEKQGPRIIAGDFKPGFRAKLMRKDLGIALEAGRANGVALQTTEIAKQRLDALCDEGRGDWDWVAIGA